MVTQLQAKFRGTLLGGAVGDALGAPFEGLRTSAGTLSSHLDPEGSVLRYTDDTHMTLGMAESLVACGGFDGAHMAAHFARNYAAEPWRGYGDGPPQVFRLLAAGVPWEQAGRRLFGGAGSFGNGAAMRVAPAALFAFGDPASVAPLARLTSVLTHTHPLAIEGAVLQATALSYLLLQPPDRPVDCARFLDFLRGRAQEPEYTQKLGRIEALLAVGTSDAVVQQLGTGVAAHESVLTALYAFLRSPGSFSEVITYAVSLGGDTDTIASMAGALVGAYRGEAAIPAPARERVEGATTVRALADALLALALGLTPTTPGSHTDQGGTPCVT